MQRTHFVFCATIWCCKKLGARVRVRVAVSILAKASFQKAFVPPCMQFLAVFHSQCLSAGTRLKAEQEKEYNFRYCNKALGNARTSTGMGQKPWRCSRSYTERLMTQAPETGLWDAKEIGSPLAFPSTSKTNEEATSPIATRKEGSY